MVKITFYKDDTGRLTGFRMKGHANFSSKGGDVVCSAVSMLSQTTLLGLSEIVNLKIPYTMRDGYLCCELPKNISEEQALMAKALLETMRLGIKNIVKRYNRYVDIDEEEV